MRMFELGVHALLVDQVPDTWNSESTFRTHAVLFTRSVLPQVGSVLNMCTSGPKWGAKRQLVGGDGTAGNEWNILQHVC